MTAFYVLAIVFVVLLALRVPVAFAIAVASFAGFAFIRDDFGSATSYALLTDMTGAIKQLALIAIPLFILAGKIMGQGGLAGRLIGLSRSLIGWIPGGTAHVNVLSSMFFGGVSGSAVADVSSIGSLLMPIMKKEGYDPEFSTAVTISSSTIGLIIPPSNVMILYVTVATGWMVTAGRYRGVDLDIRTMFLSGFAPGVLIGMVLIGLCLVLALRRGYPRGAWTGLREVGRRLVAALPALATVLVILGGILFGIVTAEESAAVAVLAAIAAAVLVYRELRWHEVPGIVLDAVLTSGVVFFLIAASRAMNYVFISAGIDRGLLDLTLWLTDNRYVFLLLLNVILLVFGTFLDMTPAVLIFTPLFLPVAVAYGIHPIHFGIILLVNLCIGLCTPPVGNCLFVGCSISGVRLVRMVRPMLPFYGAMLAVLLLVTYYEPLTMWLPAAWTEWFPARAAGM